jgi:hypothetical protein
MGDEMSDSPAPASETSAPSSEASPVPDVESAELSEGSRVLDEYDGLSPAIRLGVLVFVVVVLALIFAAFHASLFHWFEIHTGTVGESGPYYGFWSGFGSDIGEATLIVGVWAAWHHHNCHVKGCVRLGRPVDGTPYVACPRHHPAHQGKKRNISQATINEAHRDAQTKK